VYLTIYEQIWLMSVMEGSAVMFYQLSNVTATARTELTSNGAQMQGVESVHIQSENQAGADNQASQI